MLPPFFDLKRQYQHIGAEIAQAIRTVLERGRFILGEEVAAFETEFAVACQVEAAVGVASGTDAIHLALHALGIGPGDEVITVAHTAVATIAAIEQAGACPKLVDIDPRFYTLNPDLLNAAITSKTRAIIPVHLYGCPVELEPILEIARQHGLEVIEDCAQAHGARYHGKPVGSWGHVAAFSFYPTKNLGAYGDGGAVVTNDVSLAERVRSLRRHGWRERYISNIRGFNSCLDELQAAILRVKLRHLDVWNERRRKLASIYTHFLAEQGLILPCWPVDSVHVFHQYVIRHSQRDRLRCFLDSKGITTLVHYPLPVHLQPAYQKLGYPNGSLPVSESVTQEVLSLPIFPELSETEIEQISKTIIQFT